MHEAKINNLGLSLLIRLSYYVEFMSFLGGETQRPYLNNRSSALPAQDSFYPIPLNFRNEYIDLLRNKRIQNNALLDFCPLHDPSPSTAIK